jgi:peptidoglycan hydrolase-like protein with peptidoglycan-binding domain
VGLEQFNVMGEDYTCHTESYETGDAVQINARVGVGQKVVNRPDDVRTVQSALNRFSPAQGGPVAPLQVDGKCGPKTLAAIHRFQLARLGWSDDRVDPGGPTIGYLSQNPAGLPALVPAAFEKIARVTGILTATRAALQLSATGGEPLGFGGSW